MLNNEARFYVGIGSRKTPFPIIRLMEAVAVRMAKASVVLRSGGADGADTAFERGCDSVNPKLKQIFLPWAGFNGRRSQFNRPTDAMMQLAARYHPAWRRCKQSVRNLHARNCGQLLGLNLDSPASIIICWTAGGESVGGTAQALRIAADFKVPVINLGHERWRDARPNAVVEAALKFV